MDGHVIDRQCLLEALCKNIDEVVSICTESCVFTGLLCSVDCDCVRLVTRQCTGCPGNSFFGKVTIIPICQINAFTLCNTSF